MFSDYINWPGVQAVGTIVGSVLAIGVAIWVSHRDRHAEERRFKRGALGLADASARAGREMKEVLENPTRMTNAVDFGWYRERITALETGLSEVPLRQISSTEGIYQFTRLQQILAQTLEHVDGIIEAYRVDSHFAQHPKWDEAIEPVRQGVQELESARDQFRLAID